MAKKAAGRRRLSVLLLALAVVVGLGVVAQQASAISAYQHGGAVCANCHPPTPPTNAKCTASGCHTGYVVPRATLRCWTCHTPGQNMTPFKNNAACTATCHMPGGATSTHVAHADGRGTDCTASCHPLTVSFNTANGSPHHKASAVITTTVTLKVVPTSIKLKKTVTAAGVVTPSSLVGSNVSLTVQRKSGAKWIKAKAGAAPIVGPGAYSWTYKPLKKGTYRMQAAIKATGDYAASTSKRVTFRVK
jgi:hypothetical protein